MIQISESLTSSKDGFLTTQDILLKDKWIGYVKVYYIMEDEIKTFRKYTNRNLTVG